MKAAVRECVLIVLIAAVVTAVVLAYAYAGLHRDGTLYAVLKMVTVFGAIVGFGLLMLRSVDQQSCRGRKSPPDLTVTITADVQPFVDAMKRTGEAAQRVERKIGKIGWDR